MSLYSIAGITVQMETFGRTAQQAKPYEAEVYNNVDINLTRKMIDKVSEMFRNDYPEESEDDIEYGATGFLFYVELLRFNGIMLHSSAVVVDNKAYLFSADPGTGKSTHTNLWLNKFGDRAFILNDDKPIIRIENGIWYAYGTPWSGKYNVSKNARVPLAGIAVLERGAENKIVRCKNADIPDTLFNQITRSSVPERINKIYDLADSLTCHVPIWRLQCNMDPEAAIVSYEAMSGEKFVPTTK